jgi:sugar phosphate permease
MCEDSPDGDGNDFKPLLNTPRVSNTHRLFALEGAVTFLVAIAGLWLLPDTPRTTRWLTPAERELAHNRMQKDNVENMNEDVSAMEGLKQAARDYKTWIFVFMQMFHYSALAFNNFFPT